MEINNGVNSLNLDLVGAGVARDTHPITWVEITLMKFFVEV